MSSRGLSFGVAARSRKGLVFFWIALFIGMIIAASAGALLGAPTLRLRGDYLAIVTLGFGEIVPRVFRNAGVWTGGVPGISALDVPTLPGWFVGPWIGQDFAWVPDFRFTSANLTGAGLFANLELGLAHYQPNVAGQAIAYVHARNVAEASAGNAEVSQHIAGVGAAAERAEAAREGRVPSGPRTAGFVGGDSGRLRCERSVSAAASAGIRAA